jgi:hypothetical protein
MKVKRRLAIAPVVIVAAAALVLGPVALAALGTASNVILGTTKIGAFPVGGSYLQAQKALGGPYSSNQLRSTCTASFVNGVTITWHRNGLKSSLAKACVTFMFARVDRAKTAAPVWRTNKGLRIDSPTSQIKTLYPSAKSTASVGYSVWTLQRTSTASLQAWVKDGKVAFFRLTKS